MSTMRSKYPCFRPWSLVPLRFNISSLILIGDRFQLGPVVLSQVTIKPLFSQSQLVQCFANISRLVATMEWKLHSSREYLLNRLQWQREIDRQDAYQQWIHTHWPSNIACTKTSASGQTNTFTTAAWQLKFHPPKIRRKILYSMSTMCSSWISSKQMRTIRIFTTKVRLCSSKVYWKCSSDTPIQVCMDSLTESSHHMRCKKRKSRKISGKRVRWDAAKLLCFD